MLGFLILFHAIFSIYRLVVFLPAEIKMITNNKFVPIQHFQINIFAEAYLALVVMAISYMYKNGTQLQQELDLTV